VIECAAPNPDVYKFDSRIWRTASASLGPPGGQPASLSGDQVRGPPGCPLLTPPAAQLLQQSCKLVNTDWCVGAVVYTGPQTKAGLNRGAPPFKRAEIDHKINNFAIFIFCFQLLLVIIMGSIGDAKRDQNMDSMSYLMDKSSWYALARLRPRCLTRVALAQVRQADHPAAVPAAQLDHDPHFAESHHGSLQDAVCPLSLQRRPAVRRGAHRRSVQTLTHSTRSPPPCAAQIADVPARANSTATVEDLGQIQFVLSDKTGTLTQNSMVFRQCAVGARVYGAAECEHGAWRAPPVRWRVWAHGLAQAAR
jgi:hypothetical protein